MTFYSAITTADATFNAAADHAAYLDAYARAAARAAHSYFDQHIIRDDDGTYWVADEGAYESIIECLVDRIVHTVDAGRIDD